MKSSRIRGLVILDGSGNFWLFGGSNGLLNDLWKFKQWAWISGTNPNNCGTGSLPPCYPSGVYGTQGVPQPVMFPEVAFSPVSGSTPASTFGSLEAMGSTIYGAISHRSAVEVGLIGSVCL